MSRRLVARCLHFRWITCSQRITWKSHKVIFQVTLPTTDLKLFLGTNKNSKLSWHRKDIPSGKLTNNYGKSAFFMGTSAISMAMFNSILYVCQGVWVVFSMKTKPFISFIDGIFHENKASSSGEPHRNPWETASAAVRCDHWGEIHQ